MLIRCPECTFTREVDTQNISPRATLATCPKCKARFRFRALPQTEDDRDGSAGGKNIAATQNEPAQKQTVKPAQAAPPNSESSPDSPNPSDPSAQSGTDDIWSALENLNDLQQEQKQPSAPEDQPKKSPAESDRPYASPEDSSSSSSSSGSAGSSGGFSGRQGAQNKAPSALLANSGSIPWEYKGGFCTPKGFFATMLLIFTKTPVFFANTPAKGSLIPALVFALLMCILQFAVLIRTQMQVFEEVILNKIQFSVGSVIEISVIFVLSIIVLLLLMSGAVNFIAKTVAPDKAKFNITFKIIAYSMASLILSPIPQFGFLASEIGSIALCAMGMRHAYKLGWGTALIIISPRILILAAMNI
jgi:hypothetical protein